MKRIFIFICYVFVGNAQAQYIDVRAGFSLPSGSFANTNINRGEDGFATSGNTFGASLNYLFYKNLGVCGIYQNSTFGMNITSFNKQTTATAPPNVQYAVNTNEKFRSSSAMVGPYVTLGKKNLTLDARLLIGYASLALPKLIYTTTFNNNSYNTITENQQNGAFTVGYGFTVKYALPKDFYLTLNIDNLNANMQFNKNGIITSTNEVVEKPLRANLLTLGFGYAIQ